MASEKIGEVQMASSSWIPGTIYPVYWDKNTGQVYVATEYAGTASSKEQAMIEAEYYATTGKARS